MHINLHKAYIYSHKQICTHIFTHTHIRQDIDKGTYTLSILFRTITKIFIVTTLF